MRELLRARNFNGNKNIDEMIASEMRDGLRGSGPIIPAGLSGRISA